MNSYRATLSYRGTHYFGWQVQKIERSVQGELLKALSKLSKSDNVRAIASGRTDTGVHALGQVVRIDLPLQIEAEALGKGLNSLLPLDIRIVEIEPVRANFNPISDSLWKEYHYLFCAHKNIPPQFIDLVVPYAFDLDLELMQKGAEMMVGEHDFKNFFCTGSDIHSTVRTILEAELSAEKLQIPGLSLDCVKFRVRGTGFLKQMVRLMMGSLWHLGRGKIDLATLEQALSGKSCGKVGPTAPPQGLYLHQVQYNF